MNPLKIAAAAVFLCAGTLASQAFAQAKPLVGIALPNKSEARWISDGQNIVAGLKAKGYATDLQYSEYDVPTQVSQIENLITKGAKALVIAPIDGKTLSDVLQRAASQGIKIISYDRMIAQTKNVDYYATFDNYQVGVLQAQSIVSNFQKKNAKSFNIEIFGGSIDDNNAHVIYAGGMSVLKPYLDSGKFVVRSKQTALEKVATYRWEGSAAQSRMDNLLSAYYGNTRLDAVWAPNDATAIGIISSLKGVGYGSPQQPMPVVTGQDADLPNIKAIIRGDQASTVFKDTRQLAGVAADMVDAALAGKPVPVNDTKSYNNGVKVIPTYLVKPVLVDASNWKELLVKSGFYAESRLK
ncbi:sugar ABC transporter substrate-binding protein [Cupriavidus basilensis]|uniref:Sugar ABC transporter substrate-binding protein n=1 Tax=Cupriavidus basilensis TaxID=68895 RepID=A0ABT6ANT6_9BURK|nr:multiple monosaccharide ABC transporter substrate-binding protein [Cupriavidus basilensis]MDF3834284.1 sugar ABC transporter substrate-binding protein [Cupriavidus basilensis]